MNNPESIAKHMNHMALVFTITDRIKYTSKKVDAWYNELHTAEMIFLSQSYQADGITRLEATLRLCVLIGLIPDTDQGGPYCFIADSRRQQHENYQNQALRSNP